MHTKGPWRQTDLDIEDYSIPIKSATNDYVATAHDLWERDEEVKANARLIAAAPELLEALDGAIQFMKLAGIIVPKDIEHILAKAKGV